MDGIENRTKPDLPVSALTRPCPSYSIWFAFITKNGTLKLPAALFVNLLSENFPGYFPGNFSI